MTEETEEHYEPPYTSPRGVPPQLRKFFFLMGIVFICWVLGQIYTRNLHKPLETRAERNPEMHGDSPADTMAQPPALPVRRSELQELVREKDGQIDELKTRIAQLEIAKAAEPAPASPVPADNDQLARLQAKVDALMQAQAAKPSAAEEHVARLEDKLGQQEQTLLAIRNSLADAQAQNTRQLAALTAYGQLKEKIAQGEAYDHPLAALTPLVSGAKAQALLASLKPGSEQGSVTLAQLQSGFDRSVRTALSGQAEGSLLGNLKSLIRIRKVGAEQQGTDDQSVIARAEARLEKGDAEACLHELAALSPAAGNAFAAWTSQAQKYMQLQQTLDAVQLALVQPAGGQPAGSQPVSSKSGE